MTLPNLITFSRLFAGPLILIAFVELDASAASVLIVMVYAEISDWLDGVAARRLGSVSKTGMILDPLADSIYRNSVFLALVAKGFFSFWIFLVFVFRDLVTATAREISQSLGITLAARQSGKIKAVAQGACQLFIVATYSVFGADGSGSLATWWEVSALLAALVTTWSLFDYVQHVVACYKNADRQPKYE